MKVEIDINDGLAGFSFKDDDGKDADFTKMSYIDQVHILNSFVDGYEFWKKFINKENE